MPKDMQASSRDAEALVELEDTFNRASAQVEAIRSVMRARKFLAVRENETAAARDALASAERKAAELGCYDGMPEALRPKLAVVSGGAS